MIQNLPGAAQADKRCSHCRQHKPNDAFNRDYSAADLTAARCRRCEVEARRLRAYKRELLGMAFYQRDSRALAERLERCAADHAAEIDALAATPRGPYARPQRGAA